MPEEKFSLEDLETAVEDLATMKFFPNAARASIMRQLAAMCPHKRALRYVVDSCTSRVPEWPGVSELRGILCNRFNPADGLDSWSTLPGFTAADNEQRYLEHHADMKRVESEGPRLLRGKR